MVSELVLRSTSPNYLKQKFSRVTNGFKWFQDPQMAWHRNGGTPYRKALLTVSQCSVVKYFRVASLFPHEEGEVKVLPAQSETFSEEEVVGVNNEVSLLPRQYMQQRIKCGKCKREKEVCLLHPPVLVLDNPVCRDGHVENRAKFTAPWPLIIRESKFSSGASGVWTSAKLPPHLFFGPYEAAFKEEADTDSRNKELSCPDFLYVVENLIDISDKSLCNWLSFVATSSEKRFSNLVPVLYNGCIFYQTNEPISKDTELIVWTGEEISGGTETEKRVLVPVDSNAKPEGPLQCEWCKLLFLSPEYSNEHRKRCSLKKQTENTREKSNKTKKLVGVPLRRSTRRKSNWCPGSGSWIEAVNPSAKAQHKTTEVTNSETLERNQSCSSSLPLRGKREGESLALGERTDPEKEISFSGVEVDSRKELRLTRPMIMTRFHLQEVNASLSDLLSDERGLRLFRAVYYSDRRNFFFGIDGSCWESGLLKFKDRRSDGPPLGASLVQSASAISKRFVPSLNFSGRLERDCVGLGSTMARSPVLVEKDYTYHFGNETCVFDLPWVRTFLKINKSIRQSNSTSLRCSSCQLQCYSHFAVAMHESKCMDGKKPYKCGHCGRRFQFYFSIVKHMKRHEELEAESLAKDEKEEEDAFPFDLEVKREVIDDKNEVEQKLIFSDCRSKQEPNTSSSSNYEVLSSVDNECALEPRLNSGDINNLHDVSSVTSNESRVEEFSITPRPLEHERRVALNCKAKPFMGRGGLRRLECDVCGQKFYRRKHIKKHLILHENEPRRVYKCSYCSLWYGSEEFVRRHESKMHSGEPKSVLMEYLTPEQSFLKMLLNVLAKESQKGKYCEYFNSKETIKGKKFECEICSKKFTTFYRVRKHKILVHSELMCMLEVANELSEISNDQVGESKILSILSSIKNEAVSGKMKELSAEYQGMEETCSSESTAGDTTRVAHIQLTLIEEGDLNERKAGVGRRKEEEDEDSSLKDDVSETSGSLVQSPKPTESASCKVFAAKNVIDGQATEGKLILPKGIEFDKAIVPSSSGDWSIAADRHLPPNDARKQTFPDKLIGVNSSSSSIGFVDLNRVINETFTTALFNSYHDDRQRQVYSELQKKQCRLCGKRLSPKTNMKTHIQSHTGERRYECSHCHKKYSLLSTLKRHQRIHTNDRPFKCDFCNKAYTQSSNLKRHNRQHTGERPFRCSFCPKRYAEKFSLNRHLKKHKEAMAHKCNFCLKGFSEKYLLERHLQVAHKLK